MPSEFGVTVPLSHAWLRGELPSSSWSLDPVCAGGVDGRSCFSFFFSSFFFLSSDVEAPLLGSEACFLSSEESPPGCVDLPSFDVMFSAVVMAGRVYWCGDIDQLRDASSFDFEAAVGMVMLWTDSGSVGHKSGTALFLTALAQEMMNTAVTYPGWNEATLTGLAFSAGRYMNLVRSVTVDVSLADDDVSLRRGVTKAKMPRTKVKHY